MTKQKTNLKLETFKPKWLTEKPKSIEITVIDRKTGKSKSFSVYNTRVQEVYEIIKVLLTVSTAKKIKEVSK